jgi:hypothetical protein
MSLFSLPPLIRIFKNNFLSNLTSSTFFHFPLELNYDEDRHSALPSNAHLSLVLQEEVSASLIVRNPSGSWQTHHLLFSPCTLSSNTLSSYSLSNSQTLMHITNISSLFTHSLASLPFFYLATAFWSSFAPSADTQTLKADSSGILDAYDVKAPSFFLSIIGPYWTVKCKLPHWTRSQENPWFLLHDLVQLSTRISAHRGFSHPEWRQGVSDVFPSRNNWRQYHCALFASPKQWILSRNDFTPCWMLDTVWRFFGLSWFQGGVKGGWLEASGW